MRQNAQISLKVSGNTQNMISAPKSVRYRGIITRYKYRTTEIYENDCGRSYRSEHLADILRYDEIGLKSEDIFHDDLSD